LLSERKEGQDYMACKKCGVPVHLLESFVIYRPKLHFDYIFCKYKHLNMYSKIRVCIYSSLSMINFFMLLQ
jgi:hypothetical protein